MENSDIPPSSYDSETVNTKIPNQNSAPVSEYSDDDGGFESASERPIGDDESLVKDVSDVNFDLDDLVEEFEQSNEDSNVEMKRVADEIDEDIKIEGEKGVEDEKIGDLSGEKLVTPSEVKRVGDVEEIGSNGVEDEKIGDLSGEKLVTPPEAKRVGDEVLRGENRVEDEKIGDASGENLVIPSEVKRVGEEDEKVGDLSGENLVTPSEVKRVGDGEEVRSKGDEVVVDSSSVEKLGGENPVTSYANAVKAKEIANSSGENPVEKGEEDANIGDLSGESLVTPSEVKMVGDGEKVRSKGDEVVTASSVDELSGENPVTSYADALKANSSGKNPVEKGEEDAKIGDLSGESLVTPFEVKGVADGVEIKSNGDEVVGETSVTSYADAVKAKEIENLNAENLVAPSEAKVVEDKEAKELKDEERVGDKKIAEEVSGGLTTDGDSVVETVQVDLATPGVAVVQPPDSKVVDEPDGKAVTTEQDSVAEATQVDSPASGVDEKDSMLVEEGDKFEVSTEKDIGVEDMEVDAVKVEPAESVVEAIEVDLAAPGVAIVGTTEKNDESSPNAEEGFVPKVVGADAVIENKFEPLANHIVETPKSDPIEVVDEVSAEGDSVADAIQVDLAAPGVAVVGEETNPIAASNVTGVDAVIKNKFDPLASHNVQTTKQDEEKPEKEIMVEADSEATIVNREVMMEDDDDEVKDESDDEEGEIEGMLSDGEIDGMIFGGSASAKPYIEEMERGSGGDSQIDGQIVTDSEEEEGDTDDEEGDGKELFDSSALAALLKAATGAGSENGNITITSQDGSRLFSVERPAGLGSSLQSLRPAPRPNRSNLFVPSTLTTGGESDTNLSEEEKKKLEKLQSLRVKFLRIVQRLGLSLDESIAAQVLYRLALVAGRQTGQLFSLDAAKASANQLEAEGKEDLDFSVNILVIGKSGVGKSATINSIFGEEKSVINAFQPATGKVREITGMVDGVKIRVFDTPGLKSSVMEQAFNRNVFASVKKITKKNPPDIVLYVDRLDSQTRDLNDLPMLRTVTSSMGAATWRSAIVTLTHAASAPPEGPGGSPLSYEVFVTQRSHIVQQSIGQAVGDLRMMSPSLMNPVTLVENHPSCRKNRDGQKVLPNGQSWRPQLLLLCYSMKILSEASSLSKPQDPFDHRRLFGFRGRSPPLPYMLSNMLQSRAHPKLSSDQGGEDSDIDLDDYSDSEKEEGEDEYDQLPPFKPLRKVQLAKLTNEQKKAYFEEYDYRVKLLQKKQWKEELRRMREMKKRGKDSPTDYGFPDEDPDSGAAAPVAVPLPDMVLPPSFDSDNSAYRYRFLEPTSQFLARPVLDTHGWDHDCGYDGVNVEQSLAIASSYPAVVAVQVTKDKKEFSINLDSSVSAKHGDNGSTMAGFDIQPIGKQLAYVVRAETKFKNLKKNKTAAGVSVTFLGENVATGLKVEDQIVLGKQYVLVGSAGTVRSQSDAAYGANIELQRRELDYPIGQVQSTFGLSIIKWRGDLALGFNSLAQFSIGRNSKVAVRAGINNKLTGQINVRTSSSEHLALALAGIVPTVLAIYRKFWPDVGDKYSIY